MHAADLSTTARADRKNHRTLARSRNHAVLYAQPHGPDLSVCPGRSCPHSALARVADDASTIGPDRRPHRELFAGVLARGGRVQQTNAAARSREETQMTEQQIVETTPERSAAKPQGDVSAPPGPPVPTRSRKLLPTIIVFGVLLVAAIVVWEEFFATPAVPPS